MHSIAFLGGCPAGYLAPVSQQMVLNYIAERTLGLQKSY